MSITNPAPSIKKIKIKVLAQFTGQEQMNTGHFANVSLRKLSLSKRPLSLRKRIQVDSQTSSNYF